MVRGVREVSETVGTSRSCLASDDGQCPKFVTPLAAKPLIYCTASPHRSEGKCYKVFLELLVLLFMFRTGIASIDRSTTTRSSSPRASHHSLFTACPLNKAHPAPIGSSRPVVRSAVKPQLAAPLKMQERPVGRDV